MDTNKILSADLLDLIFDDRNKDYGAYALRKTYQRRVAKSLIFTGLFVALTCTGVVLANKLEPKESNPFVIRQVDLESIKPEEREPIPEPPKKVAPPQVQIEKLTTLIITKDEEVVEPPPTQIDLTDSKIGLIKTEGIVDDQLAITATIGEGKDILETKILKEPDIWTKVEVDAEFDGNWGKFLLRNLNPQIPVDNNAPAGNYTVVIQFVVDVDGTVSDLKALTNHGFGLEEEAMRVLRKAKQWEPAIQNGRKVKAYRKQPITFQVTEEQ